MHRTTEIDACDVLLQGVVWDDADAELFLGGVDAQEGEAEEEGKGLGEEGDC